MTNQVCLREGYLKETSYRDGSESAYKTITTKERSVPTLLSKLNVLDSDSHVFGMRVSINDGKKSRDRDPYVLVNYPQRYNFICFNFIPMFLTTRQTTLLKRY